MSLLALIKDFSQEVVETTAHKEYTGETRQGEMCFPPFFRSLPTSLLTAVVDSSVVWRATLRSSSSTSASPSSLVRGSPKTGGA